MTVVQDAPDARAAASLRTVGIRSKLGKVADLRDEVVSLIQQARDLDDAAVLGYPSWTAYVEAEYGGVLPRLTRDERQPIVAALAAAGMSTRAIAPVVGVDHATAARDVARVASATPDQPGAQDRAGGAGGAGDAAAPAPPAPITGRDGKTYQRPEPKRHLTLAPELVAEPAPPAERPQPVLAGDDLTRYDAEKNAKATAYAFTVLAAFEHQVQRDMQRDAWPIGRDAVPPTQRAHVTPARARDIAAALLVWADETETAS